MVLRWVWSAFHDCRAVKGNIPVILRLFVFRHGYAVSVEASSDGS